MKLKINDNINKLLLNFIRKNSNDIKSTNIVLDFNKLEVVYEDINSKIYNSSLSYYGKSKELLHEICLLNKDIFESNNIYISNNQTLFECIPFLESHDIKINYKNFRKKPFYNILSNNDRNQRFSIDKIKNLTNKSFVKKEILKSKRVNLSFKSTLLSTTYYL